MTMLAPRGKVIWYDATTTDTRIAQTTLLTRMVLRGLPKPWGEFAPDSPLEEAVSSEPVSERRIPC